MPIKYKKVNQPVSKKSERKQFVLKLIKLYNGTLQMK